MTRNRKGLRPLSQTGLLRIPLNPHQRNFTDGGNRIPRIGTLDAVNELLAVTDMTLHPTKGFRSLSVKRSRAQMVISSIMNGGHGDIRAIAHFLREGY